MKNIEAEKLKELAKELMQEGKDMEAIRVYNEAYRLQKYGNPGERGVADCELICNPCDKGSQFRTYRKRPVSVLAKKMKHEFEVETLEGWMRGKAGDYLIRGVEGELYPCDAQIFHKTYEVVF